MADVDVLIVGGGICGVLAGRRFAQEGLSYKIIERNGDYGGVWAYRANDYSHLQAHAALYEWDWGYKLDKFPFRKCPGSTVLNTLRTFATDHGLREHTFFHTQVTSMKRAKDCYSATCSDSRKGKEFSLHSRAVFVCCGILGRQFSISDRFMRGLEAYKGLPMFAGKQGDKVNHLENGKAKSKDVVILGSGAFGLEAMEAACRSRARSITLVTRDRDRWIVPYSEQFKFVFLSLCPFLPRKLRCLLLEWWLSSLYRKCCLTHMLPPASTPQLFTGQCNDAFFQYARQGKARYIVSEVERFEDKAVHLKSGEVLNADILVTALGHEIQKAPSFLEGLGVGLTKDLHNFAFLGKNPDLGCASDWVWFNVPHGPMKQIDSFVAARKACQAGNREAVKQNLLPTPFEGCKGEPLNYKFPSGMKERRRSYWRSLSAGLTWHKKTLLSVTLSVRELGLWLLCCGMYIYEYLCFMHWAEPPKLKTV